MKKTKEDITPEDVYKKWQLVDRAATEATKLIWDIIKNEKPHDRLLIYSRVVLLLYQHHFAMVLNGALKKIDEVENETQ